MERDGRMGGGSRKPYYYVAVKAQTKTHAIEIHVFSLPCLPSISFAAKSTLLQLEFSVAKSRTKSRSGDYEANEDELLVDDGMFPIFQRSLELEEQSKKEGFISTLRSNFNDSTSSMQNAMFSAAAVVEDGGARMKLGMLKRSFKKAKKAQKKRRDSADKVLQRFIRAARFTRSSNAIHPSARLQLHGLYMQAQHGDCAKSVGELGDADNDAASVVVAMKREAWESCKGESQEGERGGGREGRREEA